MPDDSKAAEPFTPPPPANAQVPVELAGGVATPLSEEEAEELETLEDKMEAVLEGRRTGEPHEKMVARIEKALAKLDGKGYWASLWGGVIKLQCKYCPWDAVNLQDDVVPLRTASERMGQHLTALAASHTGPAIYDRYGRYLGG